MRGDSTFQTVVTDLVNDTSPQLGGNLDVNTKNIVFGDSGSSSDDRLTFGAGTDLSIYHDGSGSYIEESGTGQLSIESNVTNILNAAGNEYCARFIEDGAVNLYYNGTKKIETTDTGVKIDGGLLEIAHTSLLYTSPSPRDRG